MKKYIAITMLFFIVVTVSGCSGNKSKNVTENSVDKVLKEQTEDKDSENVAEDSRENQITSDDTNNRQEVDIDLTVMDSDMVYATIYQILSNPESYVGQTIKAKGIYTSSYYEETNMYYHFVVIEDAAACCSQGLEFVWEEGTHVYPDEYPQEQAEIIVTGTFETYTEAGDDSMYAHLNHASLDVIK